MTHAPLMLTEMPAAESYRILTLANPERRIVLGIVALDVLCLLPFTICAYPCRKDDRMLQAASKIKYAPSPRSPLLSGRRCCDEGELRLLGVQKPGVTLLRMMRRSSGFSFWLFYLESNNWF